MLPLTLLTYNVHLFPPIVALLAWLRGDVAVKDDALRCRKIAQCIAGTNADVVVLCEVWYNRYAESLVAALRQHYPYAVVAPSCGNLLRRELLGSGLLLLSKYPLAEAEFIPYEARAGEDRWARKGFVRASLELTPLNFIGVFATHVQAGYANAPHTAERLSNIRQLAAAVQHFQATQPAGTPVFVLGDFNISDDSDEYWVLASMLGACGLEDAAAMNPRPTIGQGNVLQWLFSKREHTARVDYVFAPRGCVEWALTHPKLLPLDLQRLSFRHSYTYGDYSEDLSDHYPLLTRTVLHL